MSSPSRSSSTEALLDPQQRPEYFRRRRMNTARNRSRKAGRSMVMMGVCTLAAFIACKSQTEPAAPPAERTGLVAQPCAELELGSEPVKQDTARVFVEVSDVSARELPEPVGPWLRQNAVKIRSAVNLVAFPNVPTSMPWGQCVDAVCASSARSLTITARPPERASDPIALRVQIEEAPPEGSEQAARSLLETNVEVSHQEPAIIAGTAAVSDGSLVLTAYLLQRHDDLQRVMACRARQTEQEKALAP